jgi:cell division protein FtsB
MYQILCAVLMVLLLALQIRLWVGDSSISYIWQLESLIEEQSFENSRLKDRNLVLEAEVKDLKSGLESIEERARNELGMIKKGESFYLLVEEEK